MSQDKEMNSQFYMEVALYGLSAMISSLAVLNIVFYIAGEETGVIVDVLTLLTIPAAFYCRLEIRKIRELKKTAKLLLMAVIIPAVLSLIASVKLIWGN